MRSLTSENIAGKVAGWMKQRHSLTLAAISAWLVAALYLSRHAMVDDALIHLRYAALLRSTGLVTYDGARANFGTSSLLWVGLLAVLRGATKSPLLGKWLSMSVYLTLVVVLAENARRARREKWIAYCLLAATLAPMAVRWLSDGMETGLTLLSAFLLAGWTQRRPLSAKGTAQAAVLGAAVVLLRIEMLSLVAIAGLIQLLGDGGRFGQDASRRVRGGRVMPLWLGAGCAALFVRLRFGHFLPDTALAKAGQAGFAPLLGIAHVIVSSFDLGVGYLALWGASLAALLAAMPLRRDGEEEWRRFLAVLIANTPFPLLAALSCLRGQSIQGVRYVLWPLCFSIMWNALELDRRHAVPPRRWGRVLALGVCALLAVLLPLDAGYSFKTTRARARTFDAMRAGRLERFAGKRIVAGDVGFIGYLSGAEICDMAGLVNGRAAAMMSKEERLAACVRLGIDAAFVNVDQMRALQAAQPIGGWFACAEYDFQNVRHSDPHYLLVPDASECPQDAHPVGTAESLMAGTP